MSDDGQQLSSGPNVCGLHLSGSVGWLRHPISTEDTMARLALKYNTSIGLICRANRMHGQDVLQTRRHIWVPLPSPDQCQIFPRQMQVGREQQQALFSPTSATGSYPLRYRSSPECSPNLNYLAKDSDTLLIS
ncbi:uncharacterized protein [Drosophila kikkawai]|uniref:LysM domain-containing protein n=1 Tax=Drosophila kikkawai TaxID=30033 RepID=A0A6P4I7P7_DROKI|nr:uncharacterized protein LOC108076042 [Drosophila kikkawai]